MVVGLLGGFKKEDNFLGLGVFLVGLKRRDIRLGEVGSETAKLSEVLLQRRGLKGDSCGCNGEKGECVPSM